MTLDAQANLAVTYASAEQVPDQGSSRASRSFARQAIVDTLKSRGARFGLAWIAILVLASVFAPFVASSFPLLAKENGQWSSPMLRLLTPADVTLLVIFVTAVVLAVTRRLSFGSSFALVIWIG